MVGEACAAVLIQEGCDISVIYPVAGGTGLLTITGLDVDLRSLPSRKPITSSAGLAVIRR